MAEFAPNLDDGELWLPSEIIADVGLRRYHHSSTTTRVRRHFHASDVEELANQLATFDPLDRVQLLPAVKLPPALPPHPEGFKHVGPVARFELAERALWMGLCPQGRRAAPGVYGRGFEAGSRSGMVRLGPVKPVQAQVEVFGGVPQRPLRPIQNRFGPVRPGGPARECGGTGVFLPRVITNHEGKMKQYAAAGGEQPKQRATRSTAMWKQGIPFQPSSEMGLPQEWTY